MSGPQTRLAANCPAMLPGTTTQLAMTARGVDVTVTARDPAVGRQVVALALGHARGRGGGAAHPGVQRQPHDQQHGGPGTIGYCPIMVSEMTSVSVTPVPGGVTAHIDATSPDRVLAVQQMIKARAVRLPGYTSS